MSSEPAPPAPTSAPRWPKSYRWTISVLFIVYAVSFAWMYGTRSYWLDETITAWVTSADLHTCIQRAYHYQGQSPVYFVLVWGIRQVLGSSELALRSLSIFATLGSILVTYRILQKLKMSKDAWAGAIIVGTVLWTSFFVTLNARPYAAAIFCSLVSLHFLLGWLDSGSWKQLGGYLFFSAATIVLHYLFGIFAVFHLATVLLLSTRLKRDLLRWSVAWVTVFLLISPFLPHLALVASKTKQYVFTAPPSLSRTASYVISAEILILMAIGLLFRLLSSSQDATEGIPAKSVWMGVIWWAVGPITVLVGYLIAGISLNVPYYYAWRLPALGLLSVLLLRLVDSQRRIALPAIILALALVTQPSDNLTVGWRDAVEWAETQVRADAAETQTVLQSFLIESSHEPWLNSASFQTYFSAPLTVYNWQHPIELLPIPLARTEPIRDRKLDEILKRNGQVIFFLAQPAAEIVKEKAAAADFNIDATRQFGFVHVLIISNQAR